MFTTANLAKLPADKQIVSYCYSRPDRQPGHRRAATCSATTPYNMQFGMASWAIVHDEVDPGVGREQEPRPAARGRRRRLRSPRRPPPPLRPLQPRPSPCRPLALRSAGLVLAGLAAGERGRSRCAAASRPATTDQPGLARAGESRCRGRVLHHFTEKKMSLISRMTRVWAGGRLQPAWFSPASSLAACGGVAPHQPPAHDRPRRRTGGDRSPPAADAPRRTGHPPTQRLNRPPPSRPPNPSRRRTVRRPKRPPRRRPRAAPADATNCVTCHTSEETLQKLAVEAGACGETLRRRRVRWRCASGGGMAKGVRRRRRSSWTATRTPRRPTASSATAAARGADDMAKAHEGVVADPTSTTRNRPRSCAARATRKIAAAQVAEPALRFSTATTRSSASGWAMRPSRTRPGKRPRPTTAAAATRPAASATSASRPAWAAA